MTEILTESFCERCGTRYTFESTAPKRGRLGKVRTLSKGLKNYVLSDETSLSEAMADARSDDSQSVSAEQLDAFHKTFNFCMSCRQYTCSNCWNEVDGRCLSCAPHLGHEILPAPFPDLDPTVAFAGLGMAAEREPATNGHEDDLAWPEIDLPSARIARAVGDEEANGTTPYEAVLEPVELIDDTPDVAPPAVELQPDAMDAFAAAVEAASEPIIDMPAHVPVAEAEPEPFAASALEDALDAATPIEAPAGRIADVEPVAEAERAPDAEPRVEAPASEAAGDGSELDLPPAIRPRIVPRSAAARPAPASETVSDRVAAAAAQTNALLARFRPGQSLDEAIAAYEAEVAKARGVDPAALEPPAPLTVPPRPEPVAVEPPRVALAPEPEPAPVTFAPAVEPELVAAAAEPELVAAAEPVGAELAPEPVAVAPEPVVVAPEPVAVAPEPVAVAPEPVTPAPEPQPEPAAPEPVAAAPAAETPAPAEPRRDVVEQPAWRIVAPDPTPGEPPTAPWSAPPAPQAPVPPANGQPHWPVPAATADPQWPAPTFVPGRAAPPVGTLGGRTIVRSTDALWAASNQEVLATPPATGAAIAPCRNCGLSLSANARFCRRCGTRQA